MGLGGSSGITRFAALAAIVAAGACGPLELETVDIDSGGVVRFIAVEGGCWVIDTVDSVRYQPVNLNESERVDGLSVLFRANLRPDLVGICQVGEIIELKWIQVQG